MTIQIRRTLFALALSFSLPLSTQIWAAPAQVAPKTATLRATVSDVAGNPIVGADVVAIQRGDDDEIQPTALKTDAQGRFEISRFKPEFAVEAFVHAPGLALQRVYLSPDGDNVITLKAGVTATGKVVDAAGKPVANARVKMTWLVLSEEEQEAFPLRYIRLNSLENSVLKNAIETQTDANGVWKLSDLPVGSQGKFQLEDPRFVRHEASGSPGESGQTVPDLKAMPGANLKGRVLDADAKPVAGAQISINVDVKDGNYTETMTASDGTYSIKSLPAGAAAIRVKSPDFKLAPTSIKGVAVVAGQTATAPDIRLSAGVLLTGKITNRENKAPIAGARMMAQGDFGDVPTTTTGKDGTYQARVPVGKVRFYIYSRPAGYMRDDFADVNINVTAATTNAPDFTITRGLTLTGTARDETGAPAVRAPILAGDSWDGAQTSVDDAGNWTLEGVDAKSNGRTNKGKVRLKTDGDWQIVGDGMAMTREGEKINLTLRRIERQNVTLRVVTPEGEPVEGASVRIAILFDAINHATRVKTAVSNARGEVTVRKLRPDESVEITPTKEGYALQKAGVITTLDANKARTTDAILTPKNGIVRGRVVDAGGVAVVGARVAVLWPGDLRDAKSFIQSDANGKFELDNLRAGEVIIGAARGRDFGQMKAQTGGDVEIKLIAATPQPAPENRVLARKILEQWFAESKKEDGATLTSFAANIASVGSPDDENLVARSADGELWFEREQTPELAKAQQERTLQAARAAVDAPKKPDEHQSALMDLATLLVERGDLKGARETYNLVAPTVTVVRGVDPEQAMWDSYKYAQLAGIAGAIEHPGADYWIELMDRSLKQMPADDRLFRIGGVAEALAQTDLTGALNWLDARTPAEQVLSYESIIPDVAKSDLPRAQELLAKMEELIGRGDIPIEPDRNDAMYRPTPAHSLNVARAAIISELLPTDPRAAYEQAQKLNSDNYQMPDYQTDAALLLPANEALPILRAQFAEAQNKDNRSVGAMARLAKLVAPLDAQLSAQWFEMARLKLADNTDWSDETREMAAAYAFYRAESDPTQSRLLLENEWQRTLKTKSDNYDNSAARLRIIVWAMVPLDWERALQMSRETNEKLGEQYIDGMMTQRNLTAWLLASERERREMDFDGASADLLK